jgi:hypothetical protein
MWHFLIQVPRRLPDVAGVLITHTQASMRRSRSDSRNFWTENSDVVYNIYCFSMADWSRKIGIDDYPHDALPIERSGLYMLDDIPAEIYSDSRHTESMYDDIFDGAGWIRYEFWMHEYIFYQLNDFKAELDIRLRRLLDAIFEDD